MADRELFTLTLRKRLPALVRYALGALCLGFILLLWWYVTSGDSPEQRILPPNKLPSPGETWARVGPLFNDGNLIGHLLTSFKRVLYGFGLAVLIGVPLGILAASWRAIEGFLAPVAVFGRNIPIAALVPLCLVFFGLGEDYIRWFLFFGTVPFVFATTVSSMLATHERYVETAKTLGASDFQVVRKVLVPLALPDIFTSLRQLFGLAWGYIMLAEMMGAGKGVGWLMNQSQTRGGDEANVYVILVVITILAYTIDRLLYWFQRGIFPYRTDL
jgi:ABC-type nitrate/sulfonate/bicarbonate transport system permease component